MKSICLIFLILASFKLFAFDHSHKSFDKILKDNVSFLGYQSSFNYKNLKSDTKLLDQYLSGLSKVKKSKFDSWSRDNRLTFLINSYNAFTIKLILDNYPVKSIKDLGGLFLGPWKKRFFTLFEKEENLDSVEHVMIRKNFDEPRIHFAVVCASIGCPSLQNFAFKSSELEKQFKLVTKSFLNNTAKNSYDVKKKKLKLSKIFKWYGGDFKNKYGSYLSFVSTRITDHKPSHQLIAKDKVKRSWTNYDWALNEQK